MQQPSCAALLRFAHLVIARWRSTDVANSEMNHWLLASLEDFMEYFRFDHPPDRLTLCNRSNCEDIADYLEVNEEGREDFVCAAHTSSERHVSVLPKGVPSAEPYRSRPAA
jgi:hypothetical protein